MVIKCIKDTIKNINIVIGCNIGCAYCYARINNNRFHTIDDFNNPEFFENKLKSKTELNYLHYLENYVDFYYIYYEYTTEDGLTVQIN